MFQHCLVYQLAVVDDWTRRLVGDSRDIGVRYPSITRVAGGLGTWLLASRCASAKSWTVRAASKCEMCEHLERMRN